MITIFNRKELRITYSMRDKADIEEKLERSGIEYTVKSGNFMSSGRNRGIPGINADAAYEYRIYVYKKDAEKAEAALR